MFPRILQPKTCGSDAYCLPQHMTRKSSSKSLLLKQAKNQGSTNTPSTAKHTKYGVESTPYFVCFYKPHALGPAPFLSFFGKPCAIGNDTLPILWLDITLIALLTVVSLTDTLIKGWLEYNSSHILHDSSLPQYCTTIEEYTVFRIMTPQLTWKL